VTASFRARRCLAHGLTETLDSVARADTPPPRHSAIELQFNYELSKEELLNLICGDGVGEHHMKVQLCGLVTAYERCEA
jgi:hypothetical protein